MEVCSIPCQVKCSHDSDSHIEETTASKATGTREDGLSAVDLSDHFGNMWYNITVENETKNVLDETDKQYVVYVDAC